MHADDSNILENTRVTCHVTLACDERQSGTGQAVDNMLLLFLMMLCFANCKYQSGFIDYFEQVKDNLVDDDKEHGNREAEEVVYNQDTDDSTYEMSVKTDNDNNKMKKDKSKILGPHFLVLRESVKKHKKHPTSSSFSRRQGMMEGIVGALGTTR